MNRPDSGESPVVDCCWGCDEYPPLIIPEQVLCIVCFYVLFVSIVLFCVLFVCTVLLPPGVNPIAVKYIVSYHIIMFLISNFRSLLNDAFFLLGNSLTSEFCDDVSEHCQFRLHMCCILLAYTAYEDGTDRVF